MLLNCGVGQESRQSLGLTRRSNQPILKEISPEYSLEGLMLKLKFQYFGHLKWRADSFEKTLMLGKIEGRRRRGRQRMRWLDGNTDGYEFEEAPGVGDGQEGLVFFSCKESDMTERLNWTEIEVVSLDVFAFLDLRGKAFSFSPLSMMWATGFQI